MKHASWRFQIQAQGFRQMCIQQMYIRSVWASGMELFAKGN